MLIKIFYNLIVLNQALAADINLPNPLGERGRDIPTLVRTITGYLVVVGGFVATFMLIYGAFQILTAGGDPEKVQKGKRTVLYTVLGYGIILLSYGMAAIIQDILGVSVTQ